MSLTRRERCNSAAFFFSSFSAVLRVWFRCFQLSATSDGSNRVCLFRNCLLCIAVRRCGVCMHAVPARRCSIPARIEACFCFSLSGQQKCTLLFLCGVYSADATVMENMIERKELGRGRRGEQRCHAQYSCATPASSLASHPHFPTRRVCIAHAFRLCSVFSTANPFPFTSCGRLLMAAAAAASRHLVGDGKARYRAERSLRRCCLRNGFLLARKPARRSCFACLSRVSSAAFVRFEGGYRKIALGDGVFKQGVGSSM